MCNYSYSGCLHCNHPVQYIDILELIFLQPDGLHIHFELTNFMPIP